MSCLQNSRFLSQGPGSSNHYNRANTTTRADYRTYVYNCKIT